jgi:hypothetical protein
MHARFGAQIGAAISGERPDFARMIAQMTRDCTAKTRKSLMNH